MTSPIKTSKYSVQSVVSHPKGTVVYVHKKVKPRRIHTKYGVDMVDYKTHFFLDRNGNGKLDRHDTVFYKMVYAKSCPRGSRLLNRGSEGTMYCRGRVTRAHIREYSAIVERQFVLAKQQRAILQSKLKKGKLKSASGNVTLHAVSGTSYVVKVGHYPDATRMGHLSFSVPGFTNSRVKPDIRLWFIPVSRAAIKAFALKLHVLSARYYFVDLNK